MVDIRSRPSFGYFGILPFMTCSEGHRTIKEAIGMDGGEPTFTLCIDKSTLRCCEDTVDDGFD